MDTLRVLGRFRLHLSVPGSHSPFLTPTRRGLPRRSTKYLPAYLGEDVIIKGGETVIKADPAWISNQAVGSLLHTALPLCPLIKGTEYTVRHTYHPALFHNGESKSKLERLRCDRPIWPGKKGTRSAAANRTPRIHLGPDWHPIPVLVRFPVLPDSLNGSRHSWRRTSFVIARLDACTAAGILVSRIVIDGHSPSPPWQPQNLS